MGREMKGETVRGIWARRGWGSGVVLEGCLGWWGRGGGFWCLLLLLLYMLFLEGKMSRFERKGQNG